MPTESKYSGIEQKKGNPLDVKETEITNVQQEEGRKKKKTIIQAEDGSNQKQGLVTRFVRAWVGPRGFKSIKNYVIKEVLLPATKDMLADAGKSAIDIIFKQDTSRRYPSNTSYLGNYNSNVASKAIQYKNAYKKHQTRASYNGGPSEPNLDIREAIIPTRESAVAVLDDLRELIEQYGQASLADYYDFIGFDSQITDNAYGWVDLSSARIVAVYGGNRGYTIALPPVEVI